MPIKPTITIDIRAEDDLYSSGPAALLGTDTKIPPPGAAGTITAQGWRANEKPPCQIQNFYDNRDDQWLTWLEGGTSDPLLEPHIKESDDTGLTEFSSLIAGATISNAESAVIFPNTGTGETGLFCNANNLKPGAIFETTFEDSSAAKFRAPIGTDSDGNDPGVIRIETNDLGPKALHIQADTGVTAMVLNQTSSGGGLFIQAGPGDIGLSVDGGPGLHVIGGAVAGGQLGGLAGLFEHNETLGNVVEIKTTNGGSAGDVLFLEGRGSSHCINGTQTGGAAATCKLQSSVSGGNASAPLILVPQTFAVTGLGSIGGAIWVQEGSFESDTQHHPRFFTGATTPDNKKWIPWTTGPTCAIDKFQSITVDGPLSTVFFDIFPGVPITFSDDNIPIEVGTVLIRVSGTVNRQQDTADIGPRNGSRIQITDLTAGGAPIIKVDTFDLPIQGVDDINQVKQPWEVIFEYVLPAAGQRVFFVEMAAGPSYNSGNISVSAAVFSLRPSPNG